MKRKSTTLLLLTLLLSICSVLTAYAAPNAGANETLLKKCIALEDDQKVFFPNEKEWMRFVYYYINDFQLSDCELRYYPDGKFITLADDSRYDRDQVIEDIISTLGPVSGNSTSEVITNACRITTKSIKFNKSYAHASVEEALKEGKGVCWQRAKICATLLRGQGIPCDIIYGYAGSNVRTHNSTHVWLRCKDGDTTLYADPNKGILTSDDYAENYAEISLDEWIDMQHSAAS
jgi:hypothetical protein